MIKPEKIGGVGQLYMGDCSDILKTLPSNSITSIISDPPYALTTNKCKEGLHSIFNRCFNIGLPNFNEGNSKLSEYSDFIFVLRNTSNLDFAKIFPVIKPWISMPKSTINLDNNFKISKEEIDATDVSPSSCVSDTILMNKFDMFRTKFIGNYILDFGDSADFSTGQILSSDLAEFFNGGFRMPISAIFSPSFPNTESYFPSPFSRDGILDFIWLGNNSGSNTFSPCFILTGSGTEDRLMLTFNLRGTSGEQFATVSTFKQNLRSQFTGPKIIRTSATTSSLSSILKPTRVSIILNTADRTDSKYTFHLWLPPDFLDSVTHFNKKSTGFMGKDWDSVIPPIDVWRETLRIAKPGAFMLVFGGTRTYHRLACGIEDAGWMIRDSIMWLYGCLSDDTEILTTNGWEQYHKTIDNSIVLCYDIANDEFVFDKPQQSFCYENKHTAYRIKSNFTDQIVSRNHRCIVEREGRKTFQRAETLQCKESVPFLESLRDLPETIYDIQSLTSVKKQDLLKRVQLKENIKPQQRFKKAEKTNLSRMWRRILSYLSNCKKTAENMFLSMQWRFAWKRMEEARLQRSGQLDREKPGKFPIKNDRREKPRLERWSDLLQQTWELPTNKICSLSRRVFGYGAKGRLCYGTPSNNGEVFEQMFDKEGDCSSYKSQSIGQQIGKSHVIQKQQRTQTVRRTRASVTPVEYNGKIWCVQVSTGAFVARRNGKIFITGNSGFPKSHNISKNLDRTLGKERKVVGKREHPTLRDKSKVYRQESTQYHAKNPIADEWDITAPVSDEAKLFSGYGTALKPGYEPILVCMKPVDKNFANNALKHGLAGINIDDSRIDVNEERKVKTGRSSSNKGKVQSNDYGEFAEWDGAYKIENKGRWPADLILQHHPECILVGSRKVKGTKPTDTRKAIDDKNNYGNSRKSGLGGKADKDGNETIEDWKCHPQCPIRIIGEQSGVRKSGEDRNPAKASSSGFTKHGIRTEDVNYGDKGTAARFFLNLPADPGFLYCAKASPAEKNLGCENLPEVECQTGCGGAMPVDDRGKERDRFKKVATNFHPTIKPLALMKYLVTLLAPPQNPVILDMFAGSGTTGVACEQLNIPFILIEKEAEYCDIIRARVKAANKPAQKKRIEKVKEKGQKQKGFFDLKKEGFV